MKYTDIRHLIKTGDMLLWRDHKAGSLRSVIERWVIRHGTASPYTHVGLAWKEYGRLWVMDISPKGCAPRLLSECDSFDWAPAPKALSDNALSIAFSCFGEWSYSRWQAILGGIKRLVIGKDKLGQCAEFVLYVLREDNMAPTDIATPGACAIGALQVWGSPITTIKM